MFAVHAMHVIDDNGARMSAPLHAYCYETAALAVHMAKRATAREDELVVVGGTSGYCIAFVTRREGLHVVAPIYCPPQDTPCSDDAPDCDDVPF